MSVVRKSWWAAILAAIVLVPGTSAADRGGSHPASGKPPEASTVGTVPLVLTAAERAKLERVQREAGLRRSPPSGGASLPAALLRKAPPVSTRTPAVGPRNRTKPVMAVPPARAPRAAAPKGGER